MWRKGHGQALQKVACHDDGCSLCRCPPSAAPAKKVSEGVAEAQTGTEPDEATLAVALPRCGLHSLEKDVKPGLWLSTTSAVRLLPTGKTTTGEQVLEKLALVSCSAPAAA